MPHIPLVVPNGDDREPIRVLLTGFGPFASFSVNPSWLAVKPLNNIVLEPEETTFPIVVDDQEAFSPLSATAASPTLPNDTKLLPIHITALKVPVTYSSILSSVLGFHARPPVLPETDTETEAQAQHLDGPLPPEDGYDFILHVGVGRKGKLRVEALGHKYGYDMPDAEGRYAPEIKMKGDKAGKVDKTGNGDGGHMNDAENFERSRLGSRSGFPFKSPILRGFGDGYEVFDEELRTGIDTTELVRYLHEHADVQEVETSNNAGRYLCDFIYYCSLAEMQRTRTQIPGTKPTKVLFVHCPPTDEPLSTNYVTEALRKIITRVCREL